MKKKIVWASVALPLSLAFCPLPSLAADATSFDPTKVQITAKATSSIPVGTVVTWPSGANPADMQNPDGTYNWLECNGQSISQTAYPELFAIIGGKVPDYRGLFLWGQGGKSARLGTIQEESVYINHLAKFQGNIPNEGFVAVSGNTNGENPDYAYRYRNGGNMTSINVEIDTTKEGETRPRNTAVRYFIRAR